MPLSLDGVAPGLRHHVLQPRLPARDSTQARRGRLAQQECVCESLRGSCPKQPDLPASESKCRALSEEWMIANVQAESKNDSERWWTLNCAV